MATFGATKNGLGSLLQEIKEGKLQLPDFQRGWIWDDEHIRDLLVSVAYSFPIGAVMLLEAGGEVTFQTRPVEGLEDRVPPGKAPERLILDGQQRLTTLTRAIGLDKPVRTKNVRGKNIRHYYYFDIRKALDAPHALDEAVIAVNHNRQLLTNFGKDVLLDLSTTELECRQLCFPCNQLMDPLPWFKALFSFAPEHMDDYMRFSDQVVDSFKDYQVPVIQLGKDTAAEAVCLVFEKVNTGGVSLTVFELVTARFAAHGYNLRDDWFGSKSRGVESRRARKMGQHTLLGGIRPTDFLQGITLLHTHELRMGDRKAGKPVSQARPVSAKRSDVLRLPLTAWTKWADRLEEGFCAAARFLRRECFYARRDLPYRTQLVPLAAALTHLGEQWLELRLYEKLARWFWSGVLGELYGGSVETRMANDFEELLDWFADDEKLPRTVRDASFHAERLDTLRTRGSAAYKGVSVLVLREAARDWFWKGTIQELDTDEIQLDIHHIFPRAWCRDHDVDMSTCQSILNKTPISYKANRKIGGKAPSEYIVRIQEHPHVQLDDDAMDELLESHALSPTLMRQDAFDDFIEDRRERLIRLIERAMGKRVVRV